MTSAAAIVDRARALGVSLRVEGDTIKAKGPGPAIEQILPALREHKPALLRVLAESRVQPEESGTHWLAIEAGRVWRIPFAKPKTRVEVEQKHRGCLVVRLPDQSKTRELVSLVAKVAAKKRFTQDEVDEALERALADPDDALRSFRMVAQKT
jgi:hypothetical protein